MTHPVQTLPLFYSCKLRHKKQYMGELFLVVINTEEGESYEYEVEADDFAKATEIAQNFANDLMVDITYVECYKMEY